MCGVLKLWVCLWLALLSGQDAAQLPPGGAHGGLSSIWRHTTKIQKDGFLTDRYEVQGLPIYMKVRQVPGDGNCLFHAISASLEYACNRTHPSLDLNDLMPKSADLRKMAVNYLVADAERVLYLEMGETVPVAELLSVVAQQYNMTAEHYCEVMRQSSVWGGGPEIVALSNELRRPIHVYELGNMGGRFCFKRMACFGTPAFDANEPIHILSADSRFPTLKPGKQLVNGNHFLALFPCSKDEADLVVEDRVPVCSNWLGRACRSLAKCECLLCWKWRPQGRLSPAVPSAKPLPESVAVQSPASLAADGATHTPELPEGPDGAVPPPRVVSHHSAAAPAA